MNALSAAIYSKLTGDATLVALLSTSTAVFEKQAPQGAAPPYVIFQKQAGTQAYTFRSRIYTNYVYTIKAVTDNPPDAINSAAASTIDERIDALLGTDGTLTVSGHTQLFTRRIGDVDYNENESGRVLCHVGGMYRCWVD